jgi:hypothetical protein
VIGILDYVMRCSRSWCYHFSGIGDSLIGLGNSQLVFHFILTSLGDLTDSLGGFLLHLLSLTGVFCSDLLSH